MKTILTTITLLISILSFSQSDSKFEIFEQLKTFSMSESYTKVVDFDKPDTCYIQVITNDTNSINVLKNTYQLVGYETTNRGLYTFHFPKSSGARIITNLSGAKVEFKVHKVIFH